jgi:hypothetical protein
MKRMLLFVLLCAVLPGCSNVCSVYPIYTQDSVTAVPEMLGTWAEKDQDGVVVISPGDNGGYTLQSRVDDGKVIKVDIHCTRIGRTLFADIFSDQRDNSEDGFIGMPVHMFCTMEFKDSTLTMGFPDAKWFDAYFRQRPSAMHFVKHYESGEDSWIYLTDGTRRVRSFLKGCATRPKAFSVSHTLSKVSDSQVLPPETSPPAAEENKEGKEPGK